MKITKRTKTKDILPLLTQDTLKELLEKVPAMPLKKPLLFLTVGEFSEIIEDEEIYIAKLLKHRKALKAFGLLKQYKVEMESLAKFFKMYEIKRTQEEEAATKGVVFPNLAQRMLVDVVKWFGLHSTKEAEKVKLSEWLTFWMDEAANMLYQRNYQKILEQKHKSKNGKI